MELTINTVHKLINSEIGETVPIFELKVCDQSRIFLLCLRSLASDLWLYHIYSILELLGVKASS